MSTRNPWEAELDRSVPRPVPLGLTYARNESELDEQFAKQIMRGIVRNEDLDQFAEEFRRLRLEQGYTTTMLGALTGIDPIRIRLLEEGYGTDKPFSYEEMDLLAQYLRKPFDEWESLPAMRT